MPLRSQTTRAPASAAGAVAFSHALTSCARKSSPRADASVSSSSPRSPYAPTAEALTRTGGSSSRAIVRASRLVVVVREPRSFCL